MRKDEPVTCSAVLFYWTVIVYMNDGEKNYRYARLFFRKKYASCIACGNILTLHY